MLHNFAGHRTDIRAAMTTNFSFITHATQRHTHKLTASCLGNRLTQTGFTHTRRANQTQHRAFKLLHTGLYRQKLDNTFFHFFKPVMIGIQNLLGFIQFDTDLTGFFPRCVQNPVKIVAYYRRFAGGSLHGFELTELSICFLAYFIRQISIVQTFFNF